MYLESCGTSAGERWFFNSLIGYSVFRQTSLKKNLTFVSKLHNLFAIASRIIELVLIKDLEPNIETELKLTDLLNSNRSETGAKVSCLKDSSEYNL